MIKIIFLVPLFFALNAKVQDSVFVKTIFHPNQKYSNTIITNSKSKMNFEDNHNLVAMFKAQGISLPADISGFDSSEVITNTKSEKNGEIPFISKITKTNPTLELNGVKINLDNQLLGTKIYGYYSKEGRSNIDSIINNNLDEKLKDLLKSTYEKSEDSDDTKVALKIGDSFKQKSSLDFSVLGYSNLNFNVTTVYTLEKVENNIAYFISKMNFEFIPENSATAINIKCKGEGVAEFDLQNKFMRTVNSNYTIYAEIKSDGLIMSTDSYTETSSVMKMETAVQ